MTNWLRRFGMPFIFAAMLAAGIGMVGPVSVLAAPAGGAGGLSDLEGHWARKNVELLVSKGIIDGFPNGTFRPEGLVSRVQFTKMLVIALGYDEDARILGGIPSGFSDVADNFWGKGYIEAARELGIVNGYRGGVFLPGREITRAEVTAMLMRALGWNDKNQTGTPSGIRQELAFKDRDRLPDWAVAFVSEAVNRGLVSGFEDGTFGPDRPTSRAEAATMIVRMMDARSTAFDLKGELVSVDTLTRFMTIQSGGTPYRMPVANGARLYRNGQAVLLGRFRPLDEVFLVITDGSVQFAEARYIDLQAVVSRRENSTLVVLPSGFESTRRVYLAPDARVFLNGSPAKIASLAAGDRVYLVFRSTDGLVRIVDAGRFDLEGEIIEVQAASKGGSPDAAAMISVRLADGSERSVLLPAGIAIVREGSRISPGQMNPGDTAGIALASALNAEGLPFASYVELNMR